MLKARLLNARRWFIPQGEHAHRIWSTIYGHKIFSSSSSNGGGGGGATSDGSDEKRVFYRLVSGMHASISAHLTAKYLLDESAGVWGNNLPEFERRLGNEGGSCVISFVTDEGGSEAAAAKPLHVRVAGVRDRVENLYFAYLFVLRAVLKAGPLLESYRYTTGVEGEDRLASRLIRNLVREVLAIFLGGLARSM